MSKLNPPTPCRPQDPTYNPHQFATNVNYINCKTGYRWSDERCTASYKSSKHVNDFMYGIAFAPEYSVLIKHEETPKKLTNIDKLKMKIASFIMTIANRIGGPDV